MAKRKPRLKHNGMKTFSFRVVLEADRWPDEPKSETVWRAYAPILGSRGVATFGETRMVTSSMDYLGRTGLQ